MKWIKTSDQLPPINKLVLVWIGHCPDLMFWNGEKFQSGCLVQSIEAIKFWAEIDSPKID